MSTQTHVSTASKAVDVLTGRGTIYRDGQPLLDADYEITVTSFAPIEGVTQAGGAMDVPEINGRLLGPLYTAEDLAGRPHTLVLEDGRALDFEVIRPDTNEIAGIAGFRSDPAIR